jgi:hypothetical protein
MDIYDELGQMSFLVWFGRNLLIFKPWEAFCRMIAEAAAGKPLDLGSETPPEIPRFDHPEYDKLGAVLGLAPKSGESFLHRIMPNRN